MDISEKDKSILRFYLRTALFDAVDENNHEAVDLLLSLGADPNETEVTLKEDRERPIHYAVMYKNTKTIDVLLKHGAKIDLKNTDGKTAYELAVDIDSYEIVEKFKSISEKDSK